MTVKYLRAATFCVGWGTALLLGACEQSSSEASSSEPSSEPSPEATSMPGPCEAPGDSTVVGLPTRPPGYCVDPRTDVRSYGPGATAPLDRACAELFHGSCESERRYGLEEVKALTYVSHTGPERRIHLRWLEFSRTWAAFGYFAARALGGRPAHAELSAVEVPGRAALGVGRAIVWRGRSVVDLRLVSEAETPSEIERRGTTDLIPVVRRIADKLGGQVADPEVIRLIDLPGREPLEITLEPDGLLGLFGSGPYATASYSSPGPKHVLLAAVRDNEESAKDVLDLVRRAGRSKKLKGTSVVRVRHTADGRSPETWYFTRRGKTAFGIGPRAGPSEPRTKEEREQAEEQWERFSLQRLREVSR